jgi:pyruvate dehydrogenase E2 component (dihydrolipoamide acetyltransferase)
MAIPVEMPKMSDTMDEGVLAAWLKEEGEKISAGDVVAQVETDKATMDLEVYDDGVLLKRVIEEGDSVPIGGLIAILGDEGEDISAILAAYGLGGSKASGESETTSAAEPAAPSKVAEQPAEDADPVSATILTTAPVPVSATSDAGGRIRASPLARKLAGEHGISLFALSGSGPEGRIVKKDIESAMEGGSSSVAPISAPAAVPAVSSSAPIAAALPYAPSDSSTPAAAPSAAPGAYEAVRISQMRKTIARRLAESKFSSPHFYLTIDVDMEAAIAFRDKLNEKAAAKELSKVSFNDLVTKSSALSLLQHPWVNASWMEAEGEVRLHNEVHIAVAVAVEDGLITPVIRHTDRKGLSQIGAETKDLATRGRNKQLQPSDWSGSTFSTSNLGMFGIEEFTAIINPPNACILAIGAIRDIPVVKSGAVVPGKRMKLTLSCDHRVVDGATGSRFLATLQGYLEDPMTMLL